MLARGVGKTWLEDHNTHCDRVEGLLVTSPGHSLTMLDGVVPVSTPVNYKNTYTLTAQGIWTLRCPDLDCALYMLFA